MLCKKISNKIETQKYDDNKKKQNWYLYLFFDDKINDVKGVSIFSIGVVVAVSFGILVDFAVVGNGFNDDFADDVGDGDDDEDIADENEEDEDVCDDWEGGSRVKWYVGLINVGWGIMTVWCWEINEVLTCEICGGVKLIGYLGYMHDIFAKIVSEDSDDNDDNGWRKN